MANTPVRRKRGIIFELGKDVPTPSKKTKIDMSKLAVGRIDPVPMPPVLRSKFKVNPGSWVATDIGTHRFVHSCDWHDGEFGHQRKVGADCLQSTRVVQVGVAFGSGLLAEPQVKSMIVMPDGFVIDPEAEEKHGIKHNYACEHGLPIGEVLVQVFSIVKAICGNEGRVCSHHLEFDAGILAAEMKRLELNDMAEEWACFVRNGLCTMDQDIGQWIRKHIGMNHMHRNVPLGLAEAMEIILPDHADELLRHHHDAGIDAHMHWLLARELNVRAHTG